VKIGVLLTGESSEAPEQILPLLLECADERSALSSSSNYFQLNGRSSVRHRCRLMSASRAQLTSRPPGKRKQEKHPAVRTAAEARICQLNQWAECVMSGLPERDAHALLAGGEMREETRNVAPLNVFCQLGGPRTVFARRGDPNCNPMLRG
jgi:hypothetical protein